MSVGGGGARAPMQQPAAMTPGADQPGYTIPYGPMAGFEPTHRPNESGMGGLDFLNAFIGRSGNSNTAAWQAGAAGAPQYDAWHLPPWMQQGQAMGGGTQPGVNTGTAGALPNGPMPGRPPGGNPRTDAIRQLGASMSPMQNRTAARVDARQDRRALRRA